MSPSLTRTSRHSSNSGPKQIGPAMRPTRQIRIAIVASALAAVGFPLVTSAHAAPTSITTCGTVISAPGTYQLDADLTCPLPFGVDIEANNVTLLLNRHTINAADRPILVADT